MVADRLVIEPKVNIESWVPKEDPVIQAKQNFEIIGSIRVQVGISQSE